MPMHFRWLFSLLAPLLCPVQLAFAADPDLLIANFEGPDYGSWTRHGEAFGDAPAKGTLPSQMPVTGFAGHGLVNTYYGGDKSTGRLTSPEFVLERNYISFLIGGGGYAGQTCINLLVDGDVVRTATGPNTKPGGSEQLTTESWNVAEFKGAKVRLEIVDEATGGWGHINVDEIVQTDRKPPGTLSPARRSLELSRRYLNLPIKNGAAMRRMSLIVDGVRLREFDIELADAAPDWWAFVDISGFSGKAAELEVDKLREDSRALEMVDQSDQIKGADDLYREPLRPQFHFSSRRGWNNDPNGLVFYKGEYHLFYQHNPYGWNWGNMHWGHAVSRDLVHWKELPIALYPDQHGTMFSGSAVVDWQNTTRFQTGREKPLICMFTAAGKPFTQGLAFSNDRGRTWNKYKGNPVLNHIVAENRDPKVIWHQPTARWVMALYLDKNDFALFGSPDLKRWTKLCDIAIPGCSECPEFFELAVQGQKDKRWVFYGGNGKYLVGFFDGSTFRPESGPHELNFGNCFYASQTYSDIPKRDGRRIMLPWGQMATPGMPFNQMIGLPVVLTLHPTDQGLRLFANPVKELRSLRTAKTRAKPQPLTSSKNPLKNWSGELMELIAEFSPGPAKEILFDLRGVPVRYDSATQQLICGNKKAPLPQINGKVRLQIFVDRTSIDIFGNDGALYMPMGVILPHENKSAAISAIGGEAYLHRLEAYTLKSAWE